MNGFIDNIEKLSIDNEDFRRVLYTAKNSQLVLMSLKPGEEIGEEVHDVDQFIRCDAGIGEAILNGMPREFSDGFAVVVPAGEKHNIINKGSEPMKLYTLYAPPHHRDQVVHHTKADAAADTTDKYEGKTTE